VTYALCVAAVGLGVYAFVFDRGTPTTHEQGARAGMLLRVWRPDDVTRLTISRAEKGEKIEMVREGDLWKLTSPRTAAADFIAVTGLMNAIGGARAERAVGSAQTGDRKSFGLESPRATVEVAMKGLTLKLTLGGSATQGGDDAASSAYLEVAPYGDDKGGVYVVGPDLARALDRSADTYRETSLLAGHQSNTFSRVTIRAHDGGGVILERGAHGSWRIPSGVERAPIRADADVVNGLFAAFGDLKADPFVDDATPVDESKGGAIDIDLKVGGKVSLVFGGSCPTEKKGTVVQLRVPLKITGCVPAFVAERLARPAAAYVDGHPFGLLFGTENAKVSEIESIVIERDGKKLVDAERRADGLHLRAPNEEQLDKEASDRFLRRLATMQGEVVSPSDKLPPFVGRVTLRRRVDPLTLGTGSDGGPDLWDQLLEVSVPVEEGATKSKVVYLRRTDDGAVLRLPAEDAESLGAGASRDLRNANLLELPSDAITRVATHGTLPGLVPYVLERTTGMLRLTSPPLGADPTSASEVLLHLATLSCTRWAADKDDGSFGLGAPSATVEIKRDPSKAASDAGVPPPAELTIELGGPTADGGVYARVKGHDPVCVLPEAKRDAILRVPIDRAAIGFDASQTPRIVVTHGNATRTLLFTDAKLWRDGSSGATAGSDALARKLADYVVALRAEAVVHLGPAGKDEGFDKPTVLAEGFENAPNSPKKKRVTIGALGKLDRTPVYYVRVEGVEVTYAILRDDVEKILTTL
jgi:hypothetical protein